MKQDFFQNNQQQLAHVLNQGVVVLSAYTTLQRSNDAAFAFEQEANFWYLTGIEMPDWWVIVDSKQVKSWLVAPEVDDVHQIFDGSLSREKAQVISGVDEVISRKEAVNLLQRLAKDHAVVYTLGADPHAKRYDFVVNPAQREMNKRLKKIFTEVHDCRLELAKMRAIKQPEEIIAIKKAIKLTVDGFNKVKTRLSKFRYEYEVEAEFTYSFRKNGANGHAYEPIVAGGKNACTLHYGDNNDQLQQESLLLLDIGARAGGYAADITRTYAVGSSATARQVEVHKAVESAHKKIISLLQPGLLVKDYQKSVDIIMQDALISLGLLKSRKDTATYRKYFPHAVSHGLGIDVHDSLGRPTEFAPNMVLTVEPGIYIPEEAIGVRIEDDILITKTGHENLSGALDTSL